MADGKQWFKVWTSILTDPQLASLHNQTVGCWMRLCALTAQHGTGGVLKIPAQQLLVTLHLSNATQNDINIIFNELKKLNILVNEEVQKASVTLVTLQIMNWQKYQAYSNSYERVNKFRKEQKKRYTVTDEEKRREEKRREEIRRDKKKEEKKKKETTIKDTELRNGEVTVKEPLNNSLMNNFIKHYCESFKALYGENPHISKKDAGIVKRLVGIPEIEVIMGRFFESTDKFIVQNRHALNIVESQINKLKVLAVDGISQWGKENIDETGRLQKV